MGLFRKNNEFLILTEEEEKNVLKIIKGREYILPSDKVYACKLINEYLGCGLSTSKKIFNKYYTLNKIE